MNTNPTLRHQIAVPPDHPSFAGHFPAFPVLPGAVLLDETLRIIESDRHIDLTAWGISSMKFLGVVRPGDSLCLEHTAPSASLIRFTLRIGPREVAAGTLSNAARGPDA
jgi:3-hydroxymyristoyl/3-hydroxydecanoyl-(acyl carrier protein) dehydratase